jgi:hypothetical protein
MVMSNFLHTIHHIMSFGLYQAGLSERPVNGLVSHLDLNNGEAANAVGLASSGST